MCKNYYKETNGVNCLELCVRGFCCCCCKFNRTYRKLD